MARILIVGDTHGNFEFACQMVRLAKKNDISKIIQVGDFGFWDNSDQEVYYLDKLSENSEKRGVTWYVVPGNHENYDKLEGYQAVGPWSSEGFAEIRPSILYCGKVNWWAWEGKTFKSVGGAVSIDREYRTLGKSWWMQETLTDDELQQAIDLGEADYLFTHDCPTHAPFARRLKPDLDSIIHRQKMNDVGKSTKAKVWFHGHMHDFYDYWYGDTKVWGLECDDKGMHYTKYFGGQDWFKNCAILDTDTGRAEFPNAQGL